MIVILIFMASVDSVLTVSVDHLDVARVFSVVDLVAPPPSARAAVNMWGGDFEWVNTGKMGWFCMDKAIVRVVLWYG